MPINLKDYEPMLTGAIDAKLPPIFSTLHDQDPNLILKGNDFVELLVERAKLLGRLGIDQNSISQLFINIIGELQASLRAPEEATLLQLYQERFLLAIYASART